MRCVPPNPSPQRGEGTITPSPLWGEGWGEGKVCFTTSFFVIASSVRTSSDAYRRCFVDNRTINMRNDFAHARVGGDHADRLEVIRSIPPVGSARSRDGRASATARYSSRHFGATHQEVPNRTAAKVASRAIAVPAGTMPSGAALLQNRWRFYRGMSMSLVGRSSSASWGVRYHRSNAMVATPVKPG